MTTTDRQPRFRLPRFVKWGAIGLAGFVYACLFGEVFLRLLDPQVRMPRYITGTEYGIRGNIPNSVYRQVTPEADVEMRINAQGMRGDRDFTLEKPPGTCRIALMGDSYFMGYEAHYEDTIGALLETRLADMGHTVEVLNFSVSGFSTEEILVEFEERAVHFEPDIMIVQFGEGDFGDNMRPGLYRLGDDGVPERTGGDYLPGVAIRDTLMKSGFYRMLISHSHMYSAIREWAGLTIKSILTGIGNLRQIAAVSAASEPAGAPAANDGPEPVSAHTVQTRYTSALLMHSRARAEAFGIEWFMFEVPAPLYQAYRSSVTDLELDAATAERVITPLDEFDAHPRDALWLYRVKGHSHFSETGHALSTEAIIDALFDRTPAIFDTCPSRQG